MGCLRQPMPEPSLQRRGELGGIGDAPCRADSTHVYFDLLYRPPRFGERSRERWTAALITGSARDSEPATTPSLGLEGVLSPASASRCDPCEERPGIGDRPAIGPGTPTVHAEGRWPSFETRRAVSLNQLDRRRLSAFGSSRRRRCRSRWVSRRTEVAAEPPLDPPASSEGSRGLPTRPSSEPQPSSCRFVFPTSTAPALWSRATTSASPAGR